VIGAAALLLVMGRAQAEETARTRLLVKCDAETVPAVLEALAGLDVEVYDVDTLRPLATARAPATEPQDVPAPVFVDARAAMVRMRDLVARMTTAGGPPAVALQALDIGRRRMKVRVEAGDLAALDAFVSRVQDTFAPDAPRTRVRRGSVRRTNTGRFQTDVEVLLPEGAMVTPPQSRYEGDVPLELITRHAAAVGFRPVYVSSLRADPVGEHVVLSRKYVFDAAAPEDATAANASRLADLIATEEGLVVSGLRWRRVDETEADGAPDRIRKPEFEIVTVVGR
jgi:hypothetical protein